MYILKLGFVGNLDRFMSCVFVVGRLLFVFLSMFRIVFVRLRSLTAPDGQTSWAFVRSKVLLIRVWNAGWFFRCFLTWGWEVLVSVSRSVASSPQGFGTPTLPAPNNANRKSKGLSRRGSRTNPPFSLVLLVCPPSPSIHGWQFQVSSRELLYTCL